MLPLLPSTILRKVVFLFDLLPIPSPSSFFPPPSPASPLPAPLPGPPLLLVSLQPCALHSHQPASSPPAPLPRVPDPPHDLTHPSSSLAALPSSLAPCLTSHTHSPRPSRTSFLPHFF